MGEANRRPTLEDELASMLNDTDMAEFFAAELAEYLDSISTVEDIETMIGNELRMFEFPSTVCAAIFDMLCKQKFLNEFVLELLENEANSEDREPEQEADGEDGREELEDGCCLLCEREMPLTRHHVKPKSTHKQLLKKGYTKDELNETINICRKCHSAIHRIFTNKEMSNYYHTIDRLVEHEKVKKWIQYASKQRTYQKSDALSQLRFEKLLV